MAASWESWPLKEKLWNWYWLGGNVFFSEGLRATTPLHEWFYWLLNMSIAGTITGLIVWGIGRWKRVPRRLAHGLWLLPLMRLWLPVSFKSPLSIYSLLPEGAIVSVPHMGFVEDLSGWNSLHLALTYNPVTYRTDTLHTVFTAASIIWAVAAAALLLAMLLAYLRSKWETRGAQRLRLGVYVSDRIEAPAVYGVIDPKILLPRAAADSPGLEMIIAHEQAHIRRRDNLWRIIAIVTACVHWFNPCAWLMLRAFLRETETACDESVISRLSPAERAAYAHTLLDAAESRLAFASPLGGGVLRSRIGRIVSFRRLTLTGLLGCLALAAALAIALLTNAA